MVLLKQKKADEKAEAGHAQKHRESTVLTEHANDEAD